MNLFGRIGRRYWIERISRALNRAHEQGLIGSWLLHELDAKIKYAADPGSAYPARPVHQRPPSDVAAARRVEVKKP